MKIYTLSLAVRDYECDMGLMVNNANYFHYFEHARHQVLNELGIGFSDLLQKDIYYVMMRSEVDYKKSLRSQDEFTIETSFERVSKLKFLSSQRILCKDQLMAESQIWATTVNANGRPVYCPDLAVLFD